jgi:hypothetical protein
MAIIQFTVAVGAARNRIGNVVMTLGRYGPVAKLSASPKQLKSAAQAGAKATTLSLTNRWDFILTQTQRDNWEAFASANPTTNKFGANITLTALNYYIKLNAAAARLGIGPFDNPPSSLTAGQPSTLTITAKVSPYTFTIQPTSQPGATDIPVIRATAIMRPGRKYVVATNSILEFFPAGTAGPWDISAAYSNKFGFPPQFWVVGIDARYVNSTSGWQGVRTIQVAAFS